MGRTRRDLCSISTIPSSINILNSELNILDFKQILNIDKDDKATIVQLINVCYELAITIKRNALTLNQQFEELARYQSKMKSEHKEKEGMRMSMLKETEKVEDLKVKLENNERKIAVMTSQIKTTKTHVSQLQHALSVQKLRHEHDSRRKDGIISALKGKLYESYSNESGLSVDRSSSGSSNTVLSRQYDEILDRYVCQLHNNIQTLIGENAAYRQLLESIYDKLTIEVINRPEFVWQDLSCLPSQAVLEAVQNTYDIFNQKITDNEHLV